MPEQVCPKCGCTFIDTGYEQEGSVYCCEPCATEGKCECGDCGPKDINKV